MHFKRQIGFYIIHYYVPTGILVCLSWITFFMTPVHVGDRLAIGVTLLLTMMFLLGYINGAMPKVSYIKAIDWYVIVSLMMIVLSVLETVYVYWSLHKKRGEVSFQKYFMS